MSNDYKSARVKPSTYAALGAAQREGETVDALCQRLLVAAGYAASVMPPGGFPLRHKRPESKYADLDRCLVGKSMMIPWRGERDQWGAFRASQSAVYNAVTRAEARTGFEFQRKDNGNGLVLTRIK